MAQVLDLAADDGALLLEVLADELVVLAHLLQVLVLFLQVVALFDYVLDVPLYLGLQLLVPLCLPSLVLEPLLELLDLPVDLLLAPHHFLQLLPVLQQLHPTLLYGRVRLVLVLVLKVAGLAIDSLKIVAKLVTVGLLADECRPDIDQLLEKLAVLGTEGCGWVVSGLQGIVFDRFDEDLEAFDITAY